MLKKSYTKTNGFGTISRTRCTDDFNLTFVFLCLNIEIPMIVKVEITVINFGYIFKGKIIFYIPYKIFIIVIHIKKMASAIAEMRDKQCWLNALGSNLTSNSTCQTTFKTQYPTDYANAMYNYCTSGSNIISDSICQSAMPTLNPPGYASAMTTFCNSGVNIISNDICQNAMPSINNSVYNTAMKKVCIQSTSVTTNAVPTSGGIPASHEGSTNSVSTNSSSTSPYIHNPYCVKYMSQNEQISEQELYTFCADKMGDSTYDDICPCYYPTQVYDNFMTSSRTTIQYSSKCH